MYIFKLRRNINKMNILDLSGICVDSMQSMFYNDCDFHNSEIVFCDGKHYFDNINIELRATADHDSYFLVFTVKD